MIANVAGRPGAWPCLLPLPCPCRTGSCPGLARAKHSRSRYGLADRDERNYPMGYVESRALLAIFASRQPLISTRSRLAHSVDGRPLQRDDSFGSLSFMPQTIAYRVGTYRPADPE